MAESVANALRKGILDGKYLSGERLIELNLAKTMGVSQITVRDALRILEQEGWVIKTPRRGVYVRSFSPEAAEEVYSLIRVFEALALETLIQKYTRQIGADLRVLIDVARRHAQKDERRDAVERLFEFHDYMSRVIDRPLTHQVLELLRNQSRMLEAIRQVRAPINIQALNTMIDYHDQLLACIEKGDLQTARDLINTIFDSYRQITVSALTV